MELESVSQQWRSECGAGGALLGLIAGVEPQVWLIAGVGPQVWLID